MNDYIHSVYNVYSCLCADLDLSRQPCEVWPRSLASTPPVGCPHRRLRAERQGLLPESMHLGRAEGSAFQPRVRAPHARTSAHIALGRLLWTHTRRSVSPRGSGLLAFMSDASSPTAPQSLGTSGPHLTAFDNVPSFLCRFPLCVKLPPSADPHINLRGSHRGLGHFCLGAVYSQFKENTNTEVKCKVVGP